MEAAEEKKDSLNVANMTLVIAKETQACEALQSQSIDTLWDLPL